MELIPQLNSNLPSLVNDSLSNNGSSSVNDNKTNKLNDEDNIDRMQFNFGINFDILQYFDNENNKIKYDSSIKYNSIDMELSNAVGIQSSLNKDNSKCPMNQNKSNFSDHRDHLYGFSFSDKPTEEYEENELGIEEVEEESECKDHNIQNDLFLDDNNCENMGIEVCEEKLKCNFNEIPNLDPDLNHSDWDNLGVHEPQKILKCNISNEKINFDLTQTENDWKYLGVEEPQDYSRCNDFCDKENIAISQNENNLDSLGIEEPEENSRCNNSFGEEKLDSQNENDWDSLGIEEPEENSKCNESFGEENLYSQNENDWNSLGIEEPEENSRCNESFDEQNLGSSNENDWNSLEVEEVEEKENTVCNVLREEVNIGESINQNDWDNLGLVKTQENLKCDGSKTEIFSDVHTKYWDKSEVKKSINDSKFDVPIIKSNFIDSIDDKNDWNGFEIKEWEEDTECASIMNAKNEDKNDLPMEVDDSTFNIPFMNNLEKVENTNDWDGFDIQEIDENFKCNTSQIEDENDWDGFEIQDLEEESKCNVSEMKSIHGEEEEEEEEDEDEDGENDWYNINKDNENDFCNNSESSEDDSSHLNSDRNESNDESISTMLKMRKDHQSPLSCKQTSNIFNFNSIEAGWHRISKKYRPSQEKDLSPINPIEFVIEPLLKDQLISGFAWVLSMSEQFYYDNSLILVSHTSHRTMDSILRINYTPDTAKDILKYWKDITLIGSGGYGDVYKVRDQRTNGFIAVKFLKTTKNLDSLTKHTKIVLDYLSERKHLIRCRESPFSVKFYYSFNLSQLNGLFLAFEYCIGDLNRFNAIVGENTDYDLNLPMIEKKYKGFFPFHYQEVGKLMDFDLELVLVIFAFEVLAGLDFLAKCSLVHGDIKPENILLGSNMHLKIADFGLVNNTKFITKPNQMNLINLNSNKQIPNCKSEFTLGGTYSYQDIEIQFLRLFRKNKKLGVDLYKNTEAVIENSIPVKLEELKPTFLSDIWAGCLVILEILFLNRSIISKYDIKPEIQRKLGWSTGNLEVNIIKTFYEKQNYWNFINFGILNSLDFGDYRTFAQFLASSFLPRKERIKEFVKTQEILFYDELRSVKVLDLEKVDQLDLFKTKNITANNVFLIPIPKQVYHLMTQENEVIFDTSTDWFESLMNESDQVNNGQFFPLNPGYSLKL